MVVGGQTKGRQRRDLGLCVPQILWDFYKNKPFGLGDDSMSEDVDPLRDVSQTKQFLLIYSLSLFS